MIPTLASIDEELIGLVVVVGGIAVAVVAIVAGNINGILRARAHEASRREIAAYVAEGSITPEEAERLLGAGGGGKRSCG